jgi:enoyl-CoA hydratase/carnithine racemase
LIADAKEALVEWNGGSRMFEDVKYEKKQPLAWITLNRPGALNTFTAEMMHGCEKALKDANADDAIKIILITGEGEAFSAGGDINSMAPGGSLASPWNMKNFLWEHIQRVPLLLEDIEKPVMAVLNGATSGGGFDFALACDLRIASEKATLCSSFIRLGLMNGDGGSFFLPRILGMSKALEIMLTGRVLKAAESLSLGLVSRVVPHDRLREEAESLANEISQWSLHAIRFTKRAAYYGLQTSLREHLDYSSAQQSLLIQTKEHQEAVQGFLGGKKNSKKSR